MLPAAARGSAGGRAVFALDVAPAPGLGEVDVEPAALCCAVVHARHADATANIDQVVLFLFRILFYYFDRGGVPQVGILEIEHPLDVVFGDGRRQLVGEVHRDFDQFPLLDLGTQQGPTAAG